MTLIEMCQKHDFLVGEIKKRELALSCPPDLMELSDTRRALAKDIAELVKTYLGKLSCGASIHLRISRFEEAELLYFNTWFNLHIFAEDK